METCRVDREMAESVAGSATAASRSLSKSIVTCSSRGLFTAASGEMLGCLSHPVPHTRLIPFSSLAAAVLIILALLLTAARESSLSVSMQRKQGC
jgi:hypothetical protein